MPIDRADVMAMWKRSDLAIPPRQDQDVRFWTLEMSETWTALLNWLQERLEEKQQEYDVTLEYVKNTGEYGHDALMKAKVRLDIAHAQVLLLGNIQAKVKSFHEKE